jgi:hypothetical protein
MAEVCRFFNDLAYTANDVNNNFYNFKKKLDGVIVSANNDNNDLLHSAAAAYASTVKAGVAWKLGSFYENTTDATLNHDPVTNTYKRIDRIVIRLTIGSSTFALTIIKGVETTGSPTAPTVTSATDIMISQVQINNATGTPVYTITDERQFIFNSDSKKFYVTNNLTIPAIYSNLEIYANGGGVDKTINISAGAVCNNSGSGQISSIFPTCFCKNIDFMSVITLRIKSGGTGIGYDITLLPYEWVLLHWDGYGWFITADDFSTDKIFVYTTPGTIAHIIPAGRRSCKEIVTGAGAGGGRNASFGSFGGSAGGTAISYVKGLSPAASYNIIIGAGGAAQIIDGNSNAGGNSSGFSGTPVGPPVGYGGGGGVSIGGTATGGTINITGGNSEHKAMYSATPTYRGGNGGASYWGGGGRGLSPADTPSEGNGIAYGSGGGGAYNTNSGKGADGIIVISYGNAQ